jgi:hypothetical protein
VLHPTTPTSLHVAWANIVCWKELEEYVRVRFTTSFYSISF